METKEIFKQIELIRHKYEEIAKISGENFNIFNVLGLTSNEVRTHSAFVAELLNPKGGHDQNNAFLDLFCKQFNITNIDTLNCKVEIEKIIGIISENYEDGGRIDIVVHDVNRNGFIIENKIYAGDQSKQLIRYNNWAKNHLNIDYKLFYLTLFGDSASIESITNNDGLIAYDSISYSYDIIEWLKDCQKQAVNHPTLRETIRQYINLLKILTHQTNNNNMQQEIKEIILDNLESVNNLIASKNNLINELIKIVESIKQEIQLTDYFEENIALDWRIDTKVGTYEGERLTKYYFSYKNIKMFDYGIIINSSELALSAHLILQSNNLQSKLNASEFNFKLLYVQHRDLLKAKLLKSLNNSLSKIKTELIPLSEHIESKTNK